MLYTIKHRTAPRKALISLVPLMFLIAMAQSCTLLLPPDNTPSEYSWSFQQTSDNWTAGFADYHVSANGQMLDTSIYEMRAGHIILPAELQTNTTGTAKGFFLQSHNRSDDMFMFLKRRITGLQAGKRYTIEASVRFGSNALWGNVGIGGPPAEAVYVKFGAAGTEPQVLIDGGFVRFNLDKGNQAVGGANAIVLGNIGVSGTVNNAFAFKTLSSTGITEKLRATASSDGSLWLFVGTDSGFEGLTQVYYDRITVRCLPD